MTCSTAFLLTVCLLFTGIVLQHISNTENEKDKVSGALDSAHITKPEQTNVEKTFKADKNELESNVRDVRLRTHMQC